MQLQRCVYACMLNTAVVRHWHHGLSVHVSCCVMHHAVPDFCKRKEVQRVAQLPDAGCVFHNHEFFIKQTRKLGTTLILPTGELCFEPVVFNRRRHQ